MSVTFQQDSPDPFAVFKRIPLESSSYALIEDEEDNPFQCSISASEKEERCANCGGRGIYSEYWSQQAKICKRCQGTGIEIER